MTDTEKKAKVEKKEKEEKKKDEGEEVDSKVLRQPGIPSKVLIHPLVLLSVVDHYTRVAKGAPNRVVGILLGEMSHGKADITNSFALPFSEDPKNPKVWYLDHAYHEAMFAMFKKVNASEKVIGWYSTGPKIRASDLDIHEVIRRYTAEPILVIIDVNPADEAEIPTKAYVSVEAPPEAKSESRQNFVYLPSEIGAYEAEEVGVEHLLREIRDSRVSTLSDSVAAKLGSLRALEGRMHEMYQYLDNVCKGRLPVNHRIIYSMQDIFNLCPDMKKQELVKAFAVKTNDNMLVMYLSSLIRSIIALHDLINNKFMNRLAEKKGAQEKPEAKKVDGNGSDEAKDELDAEALGQDE